MSSLACSGELVGWRRPSGKSRRALRSRDLRLVVAFLDMDGLKRINDSRGHAAGDRLLREVAGVLKGRFRGQDLLLRYGGGEFVCVLTGTDIPSAARLCEEFGSALAPSGHSFSVGLAQLQEGDDPAALGASRRDAL